MQPYMFQDLMFFSIFALIVVSVFLAWFFQHKARTKERLALIEKGVEIERISKNHKPSLKPLKVFIILIGLAAVFGIYSIFQIIDERNTIWITKNAAGEKIESNTRPPLGSEIVGFRRRTTVNDTAYPFVFFLCMGTSFLVIHLIDRKEKQHG